jgi:orotidine-5'-phosphate decarboxylase
LDFGDLLTARVRSVGSASCVGLDPHLDRLPGERPAGRVEAAASAQAFCMGVVDAVSDVVAAVKPQVAFFEALGSEGVAALEEVVAHAKKAGLIVIVDAKRGDIGSTAEAYAHALIDDTGPLGAHAATVNPYLGPESLQPFALRCQQGKGLFVLVRTSNPGSGGWQCTPPSGIAHRVADWIAQQNESCDDFGPIGAVIGATLGDEVKAWRTAMPRAWMLVPGFGAQGAGREDILDHARPDGLGALVVSARSVLFPAAGREGNDWRSHVAQRARRFAQTVAIEP